MVTRDLKRFFLSASIPLFDRDRRFYDTADVIAIRDAVRALATVIIPNAHLVWGGHPSITPMIRYVMNRMDSDLKQHVTLYQSSFFKDLFPPDNFDFENIILTEAAEDREKSLITMRQRMFKENNFAAAIFIGGMEGIFDEYILFRASHPNALILPVASTGAAARILFDNSEIPYNERLFNDYAYMALFRELLTDFI